MGLSLLSLSVSLFLCLSLSLSLSVCVSLYAIAVNTIIGRLVFKYMPLLQYIYIQYINTILFMAIMYLLLCTFCRFQTDDPFCSEVDSSVMENLETCVGFQLSGVLMEKIDSCKEK